MNLDHAAYYQTRVLHRKKFDSRERQSSRCICKTLPKYGYRPCLYTSSDWMLKEYTAAICLRSRRCTASNASSENPEAPKPVLPYYSALSPTKLASWTAPQTLMHSPLWVYAPGRCSVAHLVLPLSAKSFEVDSPLLHHGAPRQLLRQHERS